MKSNHPYGYSGKILRVDLTTAKITEEVPEEPTLRQYLGGTGIGIKYLYEEVSPETQWHQPNNRLIFASGPVGGTPIGGSGCVSIVTKGPLTKGAAAVQANGFLGAFIKFCGFDVVIFQGAAKSLVYLHICDGKAELKDATHLAGKDTWETEEQIKKELGKSERQMSVFGIGPGGENLVKFACIVGDKGHVAAHNGAGAVMGSKKLKAIAVDRGKKRVEVADKDRLSFLAKDMFEKVTTPGSSGGLISKFGTTGNIASAKGRLKTGYLPVKNYTTSIFPEWVDFTREHIDTLFEAKNSRCWACRFNHCRMLKVKEGPYAGYEGEEPEYEQWASFGPVIGQKDPMETFMISNEVDRLGLDANYSGWLIGWLMECYEKKLISKKDLDGVDLSWGNSKAALAMLRKIALRQGVGDILAQGILEAKEHFGPEAGKLAIYTKKGNTPRSHDHRASWRMLLDTCISDTGTDEGFSSQGTPSQVGLPEDADLFTPEVTAKIVGGVINRMQLDDSLVICRFNSNGPGIDMDYVAELIKAITGWEFSGQEASDAGYRIVNLLRVFNLRHGLTADLDMPSDRYGSAPVDGPVQGITIKPVWRKAVQDFYRILGWDVETSKPLPQTLERLGLESVINDIW